MYPCMTNLTDITDLTDAALDVFLAVKAGEECVTVEHLTPAERLAVCTALEIKPTARVAAWCGGPSKSAPRGPRTVARDYEGAILDRQAAHFDHE